jgi:hypothetical protein
LAGAGVILAAAGTGTWARVAQQKNAVPATTRQEFLINRMGRQTIDGLANVQIRWPDGARRQEMLATYRLSIWN